MRLCKLTHVAGSSLHSLGRRYYCMHRKTETTEAERRERSRDIQKLCSLKIRNAADSHAPRSEAPVSESVQSGRDVLSSGPSETFVGSALATNGHVRPTARTISGTLILLYSHDRSDEWHSRATQMLSRAKLHIKNSRYQKLMILF